MIELRKLVIFLFVSLLFIYMIRINLGILKKFGHKKLLFIFMISGLGAITLGAFFDLISSWISFKLANVISTCYTFGVVLFVTYIVLWSNYMLKLMSTLNEHANSDPMTGLYNRMGFEKVFKRKIAMKKSFYIMVFDLDKTKRINDNFGHIKGDQYITSAAKIIKDQIGKNGFVGRMGGDEFIALIENISEKEIENIKNSIKNCVVNIFYKENTQVSIGYSRYKKDGITLKELINCADKRMYADKRARKEKLFYDKESIV